MTFQHFKGVPRSPSSHPAKAAWRKSRVQTHKTKKFTGSLTPFPPVESGGRFAVPTGSMRPVATILLNALEEK